jgi:aerobic-type carbon monoxide dehydrogenase small subunit (CoxS/CutS family)
LRRVTLRVNGARHRLELEPRRTLADVIRKELGLTGTKVACDRASCGSCTVLVSGRAVFACHLLALQAHELDVLTIEGLAQPGRLHPIQSAFISQDAVQCGFCTPGMILTLKAALDRSPLPDRQQLRQALAGNICRCGAYDRILDAAERVARGAPEG